MNIDRALKLLGMFAAIAIAGMFWLYILGIIIGIVASFLGFSIAASAIFASIQQTFIVYVFISAFFLLFWPDDGGPYI